MGESPLNRLRAKIKQLMTVPDPSSYTYPGSGAGAARSEVRSGSVPDHHWFTPSPPLMFQCRICGGSQGAAVHHPN